MGVTQLATARDRLIAAERSDLTGEQVCAEVARALQVVAPYAAAAVMTTDPETRLPAGGVVAGFDASACAPFWDNELLDPDYNKFNELARSTDPVATLHESTDGDLDRSPRYRKLYRALGASDELRVVLLSGARCLGIGAFVRADGSAFTPAELCDVRALLVPASRALRSGLARTDAAAHGAGPVTVILDEDFRVVSLSEGAAAVLDDLMTGRLAGREPLEGGGRHDIPGTIHIAAARARSSRSSNRLTTRLRCRSGRWVQVHVSPLDGVPGQLVVTIDGVRPAEMLPILLESYGLTVRETDIVVALCRGLGTREIAEELAISAHTVRDHLKVIFDKTHVNSRGELVAGLFSSHVLHSLHHTTARIEDPADVR